MAMHHSTNSNYNYINNLCQIVNAASNCVGPMTWELVFSLLNYGHVYIYIYNFLLLFLKISLNIDIFLKLWLMYVYLFYYYLFLHHHNCFLIKKICDYKIPTNIFELHFLNHNLKPLSSNHLFTWWQKMLSWKM